MGVMNLNLDLGLAKKNEEPIEEEVELAQVIDMVPAPPEDDELDFEYWAELPVPEFKTVPDCDLGIEVNNTIIHTKEDLLNALRAEMDELQVKLEELKRREQLIHHERYDTNNLLAAKKDRGRSLANKREALMREHMANMAIAETAQKVIEILQDFGAWDKAREYQKEDIIAAVHAYLSGFNGFLNANDMGLGKTMESFVIIKVLETLMEAQMGHKPRILWLTKSSILKTGGTVREGKEWYPEFKLIPVDGSRPKGERDALFDLIGEINANVITNYETVRTTESLANINWDIIVMDEVHKLKGGANPSGPTGIWKAAKEIARNCRMLLMLSGTPAPNRFAEMWSYLHIFDAERFPSLREFESTFTKTVRMGYEMQIVVDTDRLLDNVLKGRMVRRRKDEVGLQMPPVTPIEDRPVVLQMLPEQAKVYKQMKEQFFIALDSMGDGPLLTSQLLILKQGRRELFVLMFVSLPRLTKQWTELKSLQKQVSNQCGSVPSMNHSTKLSVAVMN
jgi:SNF2 family DNA or RNA helicase